MTTMVEKVARALIVARFGEEGLLIFDEVPDGFDKSKEATALFAKRISEARAEARAAIMAMDPDNSMKSTGSRTEVCHAWGKNGEFITAESAGDVFSDMIKDALNEGRISEISEDICEVASGLALDASTADSFFTLAARGMAVERDRCLSILKSIEPMNPSEAHLIETIVRRMRGEE